MAEFVVILSPLPVDVVQFVCKLFSFLLQELVCLLFSLFIVE